jgi:hypothetical protein
MTRGRPRRVDLDDVVRAATERPPPPVSDDPRHRLIPLEGPEMDATHFGRISSVHMRRRWIRQGKLQCVRIGRQTFLTEAAIAAFIERGGSQ